MAEKVEQQFTYFIADIPYFTDRERVQAYLQRAGLLGWELVAVTDAEGSTRRYVFKLEIGRSRPGGMPEETW